MTEIVMWRDGDVRIIVNPVPADIVELGCISDVGGILQIRKEVRDPADNEWFVDDSAVLSLDQLNLIGSLANTIAFMTGDRSGDCATVHHDWIPQLDWLKDVLSPPNRFDSVEIAGLVEPIEGAG
jgi:hypothetical protein